MLKKIRRYPLTLDSLTARPTQQTSLSRQRAAFTVAICAGLCLLAPGVATPAFAQGAEAAASAPPSAMPDASLAATAAPESILRWTGSLPEAAGRSVELRFDLFQNQAGGVSLWSETQRVTVAADGKYTVLLGAATPEGLPAMLFSAGEARWLGVKLSGSNSADNSEFNSAITSAPRSLLAAAPYAFKSVDSASLGGRAASDYVTREDLQSAVSANSANPAFHPLTGGTVTGTGTANYVPLWTGALTQGNSEIYQSGTGVGINTTAPQTTFDVNGTFTARSDMRLNNEQVATSAAPRSSPLGEFVASSYSSSTSAAVPQSFAWQAVGESNNTASPTAAFELLSGSGSTYLSPTATGLSISATGGVTFAKGQGYLSFPVNAATATTSYNSPSTQWESNAYSSSTAKSVPQNFTLRVVASGNDTASPTGNLELFTGSGTAASTPTFTGLSIAPTGVITFAGAQTFPLGTLETELNTVYPQLTAGLNTFSGIGYFDGYVDAHEAGGPNNAAVLGFGANGSIGTYGTSDTGIGVYGDSHLPLDGSSGVFGNTGGVFTNSATYTNLGANIANEVAGVWGDTTGNPNTSGGGASNTYWAAGVIGTADGANAGAFYNNSTNGFYTVWAEAKGTSGALAGSATGGGNGVTGYSTTGDGVDGSSNSGFGVYGQSDSGYGAEGYSYSSIGVYGESAGSGTAGTGSNGVSGYTATPTFGSAGVFGNVYATSGVYSYVASVASAVTGVWADAGNVNDGSTNTAIGLIATADNNEAAIIANDSADSETLEVGNLNSSGTTGLFRTLKATTPDGTCGFGGGGSLVCTGQLKSLATTGNGTRTVETYTPQSPENWMEDYGTGVMERGVAVVKIDPAFGETVSGTEEYHVFLTPNGDSKGLYVINKTATSFEVRESGGGTSSLKFDYKIVAKRRGFEAQRLVDVTDRFKAEQVKSVASLDKLARRSELHTRPAFVKPQAHPLPHGNGISLNGVQAKASVTAAPVHAGAARKGNVLAGR